MNREQLAEQFYIDDHAALFGMLCKAADREAGHAADEASAFATRLYATERGRRLAKRAERDGMPLTHETYRMYTEWVDDRQLMQVQTVSLNPVYRMNGSHCVWNETWKRYSLEKYGKIYCAWVDQTMVKAFNPDNELIIHSTLSNGEAGCDFSWPGLSYPDEQAFRDAAKRKRENRENAVKDFLYHCGHTLSAMGRGYEQTLGKDTADSIVCLALEEYKTHFGQDKTAAIVKEAEQSFSEI